jgi:hypothetical protein
MGGKAGTTGAYWRAVHHRAVKAARDALPLESTERVVIAFVVCLAYLAFVWVVINDQLWAEIIFKFLGSAAIILIFPLVYVWKFFHAPAQMDFEQKSQIAVLSVAAADRATNIPDCRVKSEIDACGAIGNRIWSGVDDDRFPLQ